MMKPGGYSSEEYEGSDYEFDYYSSTDTYGKESNSISPEEYRRRKLDQISQFAAGGHTEAVLKIFDEENYEVDVMLHDNWTPLLMAASSGNVELAKILIDRGADVNQNRDTLTVLMATCNVTAYNTKFDQIFELVQYLVEHGAETDVQNKKRMTAFLYAASSGNFAVLEYLRPYCDIHAVDNQGWNALFWAINNNHIRTVKLLLDFGLDYKKIDIRRCTPLDYARQHGFTKICELLPNSKSPEDYDSVIIGSHYDYIDEINDPRFMRDVCVMLVSMNCRALLNTFIDNSSMDLFEFLSLSKRDLRHMGIIKPYQQNRILGGLFRFHKHPYQFKSIPVKGKNDSMTTNDIAISIMAALRHFITMRASLRYLWVNMEESEWNQEIMNHLAEIELKIVQSEKIVKSLRKKSERWDKINDKADLITSNSYGNHNKGRKIIIAVPLLTAISIVLYFRYKI